MKTLLLYFLLTHSNPADYENLIKASVHILTYGPKHQCNDCDQEHDLVTHGSGTIISSFADNDKYYNYVLTASHLFNKSEDFVVEVFDEREELIGAYKGKVWLKTKSSDGDPDLALLGFESDKQLPFVTIAAEDYQIKVGDRVFQVGCPGGEAPPKPLADNIQIVAIDQREGASNFECSRLLAGGRSGGGLFSSAKELIGITCRTDHKKKVGIYSSLKEIYKFLKDTEFKSLLRPSQKEARLSGRVFYRDIFSVNIANDCCPSFNGVVFVKRPF